MGKAAHACECVWRRGGCCNQKLGILKTCVLGVGKVMGSGLVDKTNGIRGEHCAYLK